MEVLSLVHSLHLPDCYVAAGFLRNLVWDNIYRINTKLNDIDVVFYDNSDLQNRRAISAQQTLTNQEPLITWQVKNQATMHIKNNDRPYTSTLDAMGFWPEKETAIGAAINTDGTITIINAFGLESLFDGKISHNKNRSKEVFLERVKNKQWLITWPKLEVVL
jgi:uncharacterized protein